MSQVKSAFDALELAYTKYKQCKSLMDKALLADPRNERSVTNKMNSLQDALQGVNSSYTLWTSKSALTEEELAAEKYNSQWIETIWSDVDDAQDQVDQFLATLHPPTTDAQDHQVEVLQGQFESLKLDVA